MISSKFRACFSDVTRPRMHLIFLDFPRETLTSRRGWRFVVSQRLETTNPHSLRGRNRATGIYVAGYFSRASRERGNFGRIPFDRLFSRFSCLVSSENLQTSSIAFFDGAFSWIKISRIFVHGSSSGRVTKVSTSVNKGENRSRPPTWAQVAIRRIQPPSSLCINDKTLLSSRRHSTREFRHFKHVVVKRWLNLDQKGNAYQNISNRLPIIIRKELEKNRSKVSIGMFTIETFIYLTPTCYIISLHSIGTRAFHNYNRSDRFQIIFKLFIPQQRVSFLSSRREFLGGAVRAGFFLSRANKLLKFQVAIKPTAMKYYVPDRK